MPLESMLLSSFQYPAPRPPAPHSAHCAQTVFPAQAVITPTNAHPRSYIGHMTPLALFGGIALGIVIGIVSGVVGIGGGALLVPALLYGYGMSQIKAQGTSLATLLLPIGFFAFWPYYKAGHVNFKLAMLISAGFIIGGWLGGSFAQHLSAVILRRCFAGLLLVLAVKLLLTK
jgi:uncharacterized membrane protein YfcA